jgi:hypothetical protein
MLGQRRHALISLGIPDANLVLLLDAARVGVHRVRVPQPWRPGVEAEGGSPVAFQYIIARGGSGRPCTDVADPVVERAARMKAACAASTCEPSEDAKGDVGGPRGINYGFRHAWYHQQPLSWYPDS